MIKADLENHEAVRRRLMTAFDIRLDNLKRYLSLEEFSLSHADELRNLYAEEERINKMAVEYQNLKHALDTRTAVLSKLRQVKALEDEERTQAISALSSRAAEFVRESYAKADPQTKAKTLASAIKNISSDFSSTAILKEKQKPYQELPADDPVKILFDQFLKTPRSPQQLGVTSQVQKLLKKPSH